jgi:hypothetical protein
VAGRSGNIEDLRNELLKDYAKHGQADTEGEQPKHYEPMQPSRSQRES